MPSYRKDPDAELDYGLDWSPWLVEGATIATSEWIVPAGLTEGTGDKASSFTDTTTTVWLSGGEDGQDYKVVNRITDTDGRTDDRRITIKVRQR